MDFIYCKLHLFDLSLNYYIYSKIYFVIASNSFQTLSTCHDGFRMNIFLNKHNFTFNVIETIGKSVNKT